MDDRKKPSSAGADIDDIFASAASTSKKRKQSAVDAVRQTQAAKPRLSSAASQRSSASAPSSNSATRDGRTASTNRASTAATQPEDDMDFMGKRAAGADRGRVAGGDTAGLTMYAIDTLGMGKGGDTADCPFDCQCCV